MILTGRIDGNTFFAPSSTTVFYPGFISRKDERFRLSPQRVWGQGLLHAESQVPVWRLPVVA